MSTRKVTLKVTSQKDLIKIESDARTFGELKKGVKEVKWDGMRVVERSTKNTLDMDEAILPAGDFTLFLVPEKVKSGGNKKAGKKKLKDVDGASYNDLRSHASFLNSMKAAKIAMNGGTEDLRKAVKAYYAALETPDTADDNVAIAAIESARTSINAAIDAIIENAGKGVVGDTTEYVFKTSVEDLDNELAEIKKALKL
ncbi:MAG: hypothetical protein ACTSQF_10125 [Candidatus Heimdallarchaeaceae archaeon]